MKDLFEGGGVGGIDKIIEVGRVKIDNPLVELAVGAAAIAGILYTGYKILNDKSAAENVATVFGKSSEKDS
jgi:hypothetical protein